MRLRSCDMQGKEKQVQTAESVAMLSGHGTVCNANMETRFDIDTDDSRPMGIL